MIAILSRTALDALWSHAKAILIDALAALLSTERFPRPGLMLRLHARIVRKRILALEIMARRLIALEAALRLSLVPGESRGPDSRAGPSRKAVAKNRKRRAPDLSAEDPRDWTGVAFVLVPPQRKNAQKRPRAPRTPERYVDVTRLAVRLEAVTRALTKPDRYVAKLARRLALAPARIAPLVTRPRPAAAPVTRAFDVALKAALAEAACDTS